MSDAAAARPPPAAAAGAPAAAAATAPPASPAASEFVQERLAAVAARPPGERSHDEAGFLRAHQLLAVVQESLAALEGQPSAPNAHVCVAALGLLGGVEELCSIGVPLLDALGANIGALQALGVRGLFLRRHASGATAQAALQLCDLAAALLHYWMECHTHEDTPQDALWPGGFPDPALLLRRLRQQLFEPPGSNMFQASIAAVQHYTPHSLPSMEQLRRLWALLCWE